MTTYFEVKTPDTVLQIDDNYKNLALLEKHTVVTYSGSSSLTPVALVTPTVTGVQVVALRGAGVAAWRSAAGDGPFNVASVSNNTTVDVYLFGMIPARPLQGFGFELRNASNEVVFSSDYKYMRVAGAVKVPDASGDGVISGLPAGEYAGVLSHQRFDFERDLDAYTTYVNEDMIYGGVQVGRRTTRRLSYSSNPYPPSQNVGGILLAIDVTGY